jgi:hypothetical protein
MESLNTISTSILGGTSDKARDKTPTQTIPPPGPVLVPDFPNKDLQEEKLESLLRDQVLPPHFIF